MSSKERLYQKLLQLKDSGQYPFHMPGHKRNTALFSETVNDAAAGLKESFGQRLEGAYSIDITEIDGFDNLHDAEDLIKNAEEDAAKLFHSEETHFLVNGSSCGILSAIAAVCSGKKEKQKIIVARNCHISVYNAIELNGLEPVYVYPNTVAESKINGGLTGSLRASDIEKEILKNPDACAVVITSPTYDGVISDVAGIAKLTHEFNIPLIVDEAHGALFFIEGRSAVDNGADVVINSVHKTLPAMTQTAVIHINGDIVSKEQVRKFLRIYQTSSPSYILMGSIDYAVSILEERGNELYRNFCVRTLRLKEALKNLKNIEYISKDQLILDSVYDFDESKVLISSGKTRLCGKDLYDLLRKKYLLQPEMAAGDYVLLMTTISDTDEGIDRLIEALREIDNLCMEDDNPELSDFLSEGESSRHTDKIKYEDALKDLAKGTGTVSDRTIYAYPPGIPIIVCGEVITEKAVSEIKEAVEKKLTIKGLI